MRPSDAIWWHISRSTLVQVIACCLTAPSHYLNYCGLSTVGSSGFHLRTLPWYRWLSGKLWYLQHSCVGDTIVYHSDSDMIWTYQSVKQIWNLHFQNHIQISLGQLVKWMLWFKQLLIELFITKPLCKPILTFHQWDHMINIDAVEIQMFSTKEMSANLSSVLPPSRSREHWVNVAYHPFDGKSIGRMISFFKPRLGIDPAVSLVDMSSSEAKQPI